MAFCLHDEHSLKKTVNLINCIEKREIEIERPFARENFNLKKNTLVYQYHKCFRNLTRMNLMNYYGLNIFDRFAGIFVYFFE